MPRTGQKAQLTGAMLQHLKSFLMARSHPWQKNVIQEKGNPKILFPGTTRGPACWPMSRILSPKLPLFIWALLLLIPVYLKTNISHLQESMNLWPFLRTCLEMKSTNPLTVNVRNIGGASRETGEHKGKCPQLTA